MCNVCVIVIRLDIVIFVYVVIVIWIFKIWKCILCNVINDYLIWNFISCCGFVIDFENGLFKEKRI